MAKYVSLKNISIFCTLLTIMLVASYYYAQNELHSPKSQHRPPQEYMENFTVIHYTETGTPKDKLQAQTWGYLPNQRLSKVQKPHFTIFKPSGAIWFISANTAEAQHPSLDSKVEQLSMFNNVTIESSETNDNPLTKIITQKLHYFPETDYVETDQFIQVNKPGLIISGIGMHGYLDANWVNLHKNVNTHYETKTAK